MGRISIRDSVPSYYVKESRDFQMMCDVLDIVQGSIKFDIDTIRNLSDSTLCRESTLSLLQHKLGIEITSDVTDEILRTILKCFPFIVNKKGSRKGIVEMLCLFLEVISPGNKHELTIINNVKDAPLSGRYLIKISMEKPIKDFTLLDQMLKYVIPTGYIITYSSFEQQNIPNALGTCSANSVDIVMISND